MKTLPSRWILCSVCLLTQVFVQAIEYTPQDVQTAYDRHDVRQLMDFSAHADKPIRMAALQSLVQLNDPQAVPFLVKLFDDPDPDIVLSALWGLPNFGVRAAGPNVIDHVQALQQHSSLDVRKAAEVVLSDLKDPDKLDQMRQQLTAKEADQRKLALDYYLSRKDLSIVLTAQRMLGDVDPMQKQIAIILIHGLDDRDSLEKVEQLLRDPAPGVRAAAALVVGDWKEGSALEPLQPLLKDSDPMVRASVVAALAHHQTPAISTALATLSKDHDPVVCIALAKALADFATPASTEALLTLALDENPAIREPAIAGLVAFRNSAITQKMQSYLSDKQSRKRRRAALAYFSNPQLHPKPETFVPLLHDKEGDIRLNAVQTILKLPGNATKVQLVYLLNDPSRDVRLEILKKLDVLLLLPQVNRKVIKKSMALLVKDPDPEVRQQALKFKVLAN